MVWCIRNRERVRKKKGDVFGFRMRKMDRFSLGYLLPWFRKSRYNFLFVIIRVKKLIQWNMCVYKEFREKSYLFFAFYLWEFEHRAQKNNYFLKRNQILHIKYVLYFIYCYDFAKVAIIFFFATSKVKKLIQWNICVYKKFIEKNCSFFVLFVYRFQHSVKLKKYFL